jgi:hypothetical protein
MSQQGYSAENRPDLKIVDGTCTKIMKWQQDVITDDVKYIVPKHVWLIAGL